MSLCPVIGHVGDVLHFVSASCISRLFQSFATLEIFWKSVKNYNRIWIVAKTEYLPTCHPIGPL